MCNERNILFNSYDITLYYLHFCAARATFTKMGFSRLFPADESMRSPMRSTQEGVLYFTLLRPSCSVAEGIQLQCMSNAISHRSFVCSWWTSTHWPSTGQEPVLGMHSLAAKIPFVSNQKVDCRAGAFQQLKSSNGRNWNSQTYLRTKWHRFTSLDASSCKCQHTNLLQPWTYHCFEFWS